MPKAKSKSPRQETSPPERILVKDLEDNQAYGAKLTVQVTKVITANDSKSETQLGLADSSGWIRARIGNTDTRFTEGRTLTLRHFSVRDKIIRLGTETKAYSAGNLDPPVPEHVKAESRRNLEEPVFPFTDISSALASLETQRVSIRGTVISDAQPKCIVLKSGFEKQVREIKIEDETGQITASLWQEAASCKFQTGHRLLLKDCLLKHNAFYGQMTVSVNHPSQIQIDNTHVIQAIRIEGVENEQFTGKLNLLCSKHNKTVEISVEAELMKKHLNMDTTSTLNDLLPLLPMEVNVQMSGKHIV